MTITLPSNPKQEAYEDLIVACLSSLGFFVEAHLHLRDGGTEVLELDVVATPVNDPLDDVVLLEAKSGDTGFSDIFKLYGQKQFLGIPHGCIVRPKLPDPQRQIAMNGVATKTGVRISQINLKNFDLTQLPKESVAMPDAVRQSLLDNAWFGRIGKRICIAAFNQFAQTKGIPEIDNAKQYRWAIEQSFFERRPIERARSVYDAYSRYPKITDVVITSQFNSQNKTAVWDDIRDTEKHPDIQFILMMEHTARLRVVKNALVHILEKERINQNRRQTIQSVLDEIGMPAAFRRGLLELGSHKHRLRIPLLWQIFIEIFGGFYLLTDTSDLDAMSACTGIPANEIPQCLDLYDTFFPSAKSWFMECKSELKVLKMVPAIYHGTGAFLRESLCRPTNYGAKCPHMAWLVNKWFHALYTILQPQLKTPGAP
jgi:hypothetical protein